MPGRLPSSGIFIENSMKKDHLVSLIFILLAIAALLYTFAGCAKTVYVPVQSTKTITETVHDTIVEVKLQTFRDSIVTPDTVSRLENKYSYSAALWSAGRLTHTLGVKDIDIPVTLQYIETVITDSIAVPYPVETVKTEYRQRWWQEALMWLGVAALILFAGWVVNLIRKVKGL